MILGFLFLILFNFTFEKANAQEAEPLQPVPAEQMAPPIDPPAVERSDMNQPDPNYPFDDSGQENSAIVMKKNSFTYDSNEGRDPFKIYRDPVIISPGGNPTDPKDAGTPKVPVLLEKNIRTALVPGEITVMGILFKKVDPIALVSVKGVKGINKLKVNSPIGRNEGKVIEIKKDQIVIEQIKDFDGQKFTEKIVLKVRQRKD